jgi:OmcA/MtrC family decaheme c-type cytochrome
MVKNGMDRVGRFFKGRLLNRGFSVFLAVLVLSLLALAGCGDDETVIVVVETPLSDNKLHVEITAVSLPTDSRKPVVTFHLKDEAGNPLDRDGISTPGAVGTSFVIARIESGDRQYRSYVTRIQISSITGQEGIQAAAESSQGTYDDLGNGIYTYTFNVALPENYSRHVTHTVGIYANRSLQGKTFVANATFDFIPSGGSARTVRDVVRTEACNNCHDPLAIHGGFRREVKLCVLCHTPQTIDPDTGHTVDFKVMIHKIHRGAELPSVQAGTPYQIIGFGQSVHDYSTVEFPQDIRNCTKCHKDGDQSANYQNKPSRAACGSCHDDINFASGSNHGGGIQLDDNNCSACHLPSTGNEFDLSVAGSHTIPLKSAQVPALVFEIVSVASAETGSVTVAPGEPPKVTFNIKTGEGAAVLPSEMRVLRLTLAGPTTDYSIQDYNDDGSKTPPSEDFAQEDPRSAAVGPDVSGSFSYTFAARIPSDGTGTYAVGIEGYRCVTVEGANQRKGGLNCSGTLDANGNGTEDPGEVFNEVRDAGPNVVSYFPVTDSTALPRRRVVDTSTKCGTCHGVFSKDFSIHGGTRNSSEYCALCHNPSHDTLSRQSPEEGVSAVTNSVDFKVMIHKIHTGEGLANPYVLYSFSGQAIDFSEILFPGDTRDCEACHLFGTYVLKSGAGILGPGVLPTTTREFVREGSVKSVTETFETPPVTSVCTACHDDLDLASGLNHLGGPQPDSDCVICHGEGSALGAENESVHLPPLPPNRRMERPQG